MKQPEKERAGKPAVAVAEESGSLRERKHEFVRQEIERAAWDLFARVGFEKATLAAISRDAGVSRRTFFRYFESKEDLLSRSVEDFGLRIAERFAAAPPSKSAFRPLEEAMLGVMREKMQEKRQPKEMLGLMFEEPNLRGRFLRALMQWVPALSRELARRKACRGDAARCDLAAALYCIAFDQAHLRWYRDPKSTLETHLKRAFYQLRHPQ